MSFGLNISFGRLCRLAGERMKLVPDPYPSPLFISDKGWQVKEFEEHHPGEVWDPVWASAIMPIIRGKNGN